MLLLSLRVLPTHLLVSWAPDESKALAGVHTPVQSERHGQHGFLLGGCNRRTPESNSERVPWSMWQFHCSFRTQLPSSSTDNRFFYTNVSGDTHFLFWSLVVADELTRARNVLEHQAINVKKQLNPEVHPRGAQSGFLVVIYLGSGSQR